MTNIASIRHGVDIIYPQIAPFDMEEKLPEFPGTFVSNEPNPVYKALRQCLLDLEMDSDNIGTESWSPFSDFISPGNTVVIKPNFVLDTADPSIQECTTTHASIIRPVIDYAWKALKGKGTIIVGDAPGAEANFDAIVDRTQVRKMIDILRQRGTNVVLEDFRALKVTTENGIWTGEQMVSGSEPTSQIVNLGTSSLFYNTSRKGVKLHGAGYDIGQTIRHHTDDVQEYCVSKTILNADVVISIPKLKTHRKAGITCCLKNLVGINTDKNYLPHFSMGSENMGGDEMPSIAKDRILRVRFYNWIRAHIIAHTWKIIGRPGAATLRFISKKSLTPTKDGKSATTMSTNKDSDLAKWFHNRLSGQNVAAGSWDGNTTICRMILDLNKIFLCCNKEGVLQRKTDRKFFYVVDAVTIGVGNGPTHPTKANMNALAAGWNGLKTDIALMHLLGINSDQIPLYKMANNEPWMNSSETGDILINGESIANANRIEVDIEPPSGWNYLDKAKI